MVHPKRDSQPVKDEENTADECQDSIFLLIRRTEALRDLSGDITPLQADGSNLQAWADEIDEILADLIDREKYLQSPPPVPFNKTQDKVARSLIYRTIPRELRYCLRDAPSAHTAYDALAGQFLRNTRSNHMSRLVDLFNFRMEVAEASEVSLLYDQIYKGLHELVASGFSITQDALLGALFQIALGRSNLELYSAVSQYFDAKMSRGSSPVTSQEVAAVARMQLENTTPTTTASDEAAFVDPAERTTDPCQAFAGTNAHRTQQATGPNVPTQSQQTSESNVNVNPRPDFQHGANQQQHSAPENHPQPTMQPHMAGAQQPQGHFANDAPSAHIHQAVPGHPNPPSLGQYGSDPSLIVSGYPNVWASQHEQQVSVHPQQLNQQYGQQPPHPGVPVCQANPAQQPASEPQLAQVPEIKQAGEHPDITQALNKSTLASSTSHPLASSASGAVTPSTSASFGPTSSLRLPLALSPVSEQNM